MSFFGGLGGGVSGSKVGNKRLVVVTGTTSGLGKEAAKALISKGDHFVVCAVRDQEKMKKVAEEEAFQKGCYNILDLDLASYQSTRNFVKSLKTFKGSKPLDALVCNAAVYQPALSVPKYTGDGHEEQMQINHLSHFLLCNLLLDDIKRSKDGRVVIVGSITGNSNTVGGGLVYPLADLGLLSGLAKGGKDPICMVTGEPFNGAKAYKDSKICNMMTINELHKRYHDSTGITFSSLYPGCIATTQLFREKRQWFRKLFPLFMKYVTGGFVSESEAGERLAQVVSDPRCKKSGVYWSWNGGARTVGFIDPRTGKLTGAGGSGGDLFENDYSNEVKNEKKSNLLWEYSTQITGVKWPAGSGVLAKA
eukprot:CAMPEP_0182436004 /NCGR_PEP_ID=MMETSP1167-20130531/78979_1 /TAXON_ID=2988 /ORGANISM="Mallomonas Sp, Strain CCMP3275" /LENGTH=363 /DNA_ID=CAMNT_0024627671 /DNA_START=181 /DNA_END=1272 /DNA_ORIENTATION=-